MIKIEKGQKKKRLMQVQLDNYIVLYYVQQLCEGKEVSMEEEDEEERKKKKRKKMMQKQWKEERRKG